MHSINGILIYDRSKGDLILSRDYTDGSYGLIKYPDKQPPYDPLNLVAQFFAMGKTLESYKQHTLPTLFQHGVLSIAIQQHITKPLNIILIYEGHDKEIMEKLTIKLLEDFITFAAENNETEYKYKAYLKYDQVIQKGIEFAMELKFRNIALELLSRSLYIPWLYTLLPMPLTLTEAATKQQIALEMQSISNNTLKQSKINKLTEKSNQEEVKATEFLKGQCSQVM